MVDRTPLSISRPREGGGTIIVTRGGRVTERDDAGRLVSRRQIQSEVAVRIVRSGRTTPARITSGGKIVSVSKPSAKRVEEVKAIEREQARKDFGRARLRGDIVEKNGFLIPKTKTGRRVLSRAVAVDKRVQAQTAVKGVDIRGKALFLKLTKEGGTKVSKDVLIRKDGKFVSSGLEITSETQRVLSTKRVLVQKELGITAQRRLQKQLSDFDKRVLNRLSTAERKLFKEIEASTKRTTKFSQSIDKTYEKLGLTRRDGDRKLVRIVKAVERGIVNLAAIPVGIVNAFNNALLTVQGLAVKNFRATTKRELKSVFRKVPKVLLESFNPRDPENWAGLILVALGIRSVAKSSFRGKLTLAEAKAAKLKPFSRVGKLIVQKPPKVSLPKLPTKVNINKMSLASLKKLNLKTEKIITRFKVKTKLDVKIKASVKAELKVIQNRIKVLQSKVSKDVGIIRFQASKVFRDASRDVNSLSKSITASLKALRVRGEKVFLRSRVVVESKALLKLIRKDLKLVKNAAGLARVRLRLKALKAKKALIKARLTTRETVKVISQEVRKLGKDVEVVVKVSGEVLSRANAKVLSRLKTSLKPIGVSARFVKSVVSKRVKAISRVSVKRINSLVRGLKKVVKVSRGFVNKKFNSLLKSLKLVLKKSNIVLKTAKFKIGKQLRLAKSLVVKKVKVAKRVVRRVSVRVVRVGNTFKLTAKILRSEGLKVANDFAKGLRRLKKVSSVKVVRVSDGFRLTAKVIRLEGSKVFKDFSKGLRGLKVGGEKIIVNFGKDVKVIRVQSTKVFKDLVRDIRKLSPVTVKFSVKIQKFRVKVGVKGKKKTFVSSPDRIIETLNKIRIDTRKQLASLSRKERVSVGRESEVLKRLKLRQKAIASKIKRGLQVKAKREDFRVINGRKVWTFVTVGGKEKLFFSRKKWLKAIISEEKLGLLNLSPFFDQAAFTRKLLSSDKVLRFKAGKLVDGKGKTVIEVIVDKPIIVRGRRVVSPTSEARIVRGRRVVSPTSEVRLLNVLKSEKVKVSKVKKNILTSKKKVKTGLKTAVEAKVSTRVKTILRTRLKSLSKLSVALASLEALISKQGQSLRSGQKIGQKAAQDIALKIAQKVRQAQVQERIVRLAVGTALSLSIAAKLRPKLRPRPPRKPPSKRPPRKPPFKLLDDRVLSGRLDRAIVSFVNRKRFIFIPDLFSIVFGIKASAKEKRALLKKGRVFTGLEIRKLVR